MPAIQKLAAILISLIMACGGGSTIRAAECEDLIASHMIGKPCLPPTWSPWRKRRK